MSDDGELVASLRAHEELRITDEVAAQLVSMSAATIDRRLAPAIAEVSVVGVDDTVIPGASVRFSCSRQATEQVRRRAELGVGP